MIYNQKYFPRKVIKNLQIVDPELWVVEMLLENVEDEREISEIKQWAESHEYGRFIIFSYIPRNRYEICFDRIQEYMEFKLRWL